MEQMLLIVLLSLALGLGAYGVSHLLGPGGSLDREKRLKGRINQEGSIKQVKTYRLMKTTHLSDIEIFSKLLNRRPVAQTLALYLKTAKFKISVAGFLLVCLITGSLSFAIAQLYMPMIAALVAGLILGTVPFLYLKSKRNKYIGKFDEFLPNALSVISSSIKVGHGLESAIEAVGHGAPWPVNEEFQTVKAEMELGSGLEAALNNLHKRLPSQELRILVIGISVHQKLGGNLSEILDNLEKTIRERYSLIREVKALSSQGVLSAWVLFAIPIGLVTFLMSRDANSYLAFFSTQFGTMAIIGCVVFQLIAFVWIRKIINIKD